MCIGTHNPILVPLRICFLGRTNATFYRTSKRDNHICPHKLCSSTCEQNNFVGVHYPIPSDKWYSLFPNSLFRQNTYPELSFLPSVCRLVDYSAHSSCTTTSFCMDTHTMYLCSFFRGTFIYFNTKSFLRNLFLCYFCNCHFDNTL